MNARARSEWLKGAKAGAKTRLTGRTEIQVAFHVQIPGTLAGTTGIEVGDDGLILRNYRVRVDIHLQQARILRLEPWHRISWSKFERR